MRLLFVGGTSFLGRHAVEAAVAAGHDVTVFHRGRTNPDLLAGRVEHRFGDRDEGDYSDLERDERWDAVVDVCAYVPRHVHQLADVLGDRGGHHVHVSSISAYDPARATLAPEIPLLADPPDGTEDVAVQYGALKAAGERAATARYRALTIVRPPYICGPHDPEDAFTYWARRLAEGGDVAVREPSWPMQLVDARDLGAFLVHCATNGIGGAFDGVAPPAPAADVLAACTPPSVTARLVEIGDDALAAAGVTLPMMLPEPNDWLISSRPAEPALAAGLVTRPVAETASATRAWDDARGRPPLRKGPTREQEAALIRAALGTS